MSERKVGALFAGKRDDGGFMEYGYRGLLRAQGEFGFAVMITDQIPPNPDQLTDALRGLARSGSQLVIAHGGQNDAAASRVAAEFPQLRFAVTQGSVLGPNLTSYEVRQEQSAFLAGIAAAMEGASTGAQVMLLEKQQRTGGSSELSGGLFAFSGTDMQKAAGIEDDEIPFN